MSDFNVWTSPFMGSQTHSFLYEWDGDREGRREGGKQRGREKGKEISLIFNFVFPHTKSLDEH